MSSYIFLSLSLYTLYTHVGISVPRYAHQGGALVAAHLGQAEHSTELSGAAPTRRHGDSAE